MLLEVIFSIALLAAAFATIIGGFNACTQATRDLWLEAKASDLAVTMLTEIQMGTVPSEDAGPTDFPDPLADWSWQVVTADQTPSNPNAPIMRQVQITVTYKPQEYSYSVTDLVNAPNQPEGETYTGTMGAGLGAGTGAGMGAGAGGGTRSGAGAGSGSRGGARSSGAGGG